MSDAEEAFAFALRAAKILFQREVVFAPTRKWRADFLLGTKAAAEPCYGCDRAGSYCRWHSPVIVEVDGGTWAGGRHTTGAGFAADCAKLNEATILGYRVFRVTPAMVEDGSALALVERALDLHGGAK